MTKRSGNKKSGKKPTSWRTSAAAMDFNFGLNAKRKGSKGKKSGLSKKYAAAGGSI
jgi:hypothetical protein